MMIGDSVTEPSIIANDSSLCVYICVQPHRTAQSGNVLPRITTSIAHRYETGADLNCSASHSRSILPVLTVGRD